MHPADPRACVARALLIEVSAIEGWTRVLFASVDAVGVDVAPARDHAPWRTLFFVAWLALGAFLLLNLLAGMLVSTFADMKQADGGSVVLTERQRDWTETLSQWLELRPRRQVPCPSQPARAACHRLAMHRGFEGAVLALILFNTLVMACDGYGVPPAAAALLGALNGGCSAAFVAEAAVKLLGFGPSHYFDEPWHVFDFAVVSLTLGEWALDLLALALPGGANPTLVRVVRVVRVTRVLRTLRAARSARGLLMLLSLLLYTLPALLNIVCVFGMILFVYAVLGMQLFGRVAPGEVLGADDASFCDFGAALLTMFRCATGEDWNLLMHDAAVRPSSGRCTEAGGDCGSPWVALPFFISFEILSAYVVLKLLDCTRIARGLHAECVLIAC